MRSPEAGQHIEHTSTITSNYMKLYGISIIRSECIHPEYIVSLHFRYRIMKRIFTKFVGFRTCQVSKINSFRITPMCSIKYASMKHFESLHFQFHWYVPYLISMSFIIMAISIYYTISILYLVVVLIASSN